MATIPLLIALELSGITGKFHLLAIRHLHSQLTALLFQARFEYAMSPLLLHLSSVWAAGCRGVFRGCEFGKNLYLFLQKWVCKNY